MTKTQAETDFENRDHLWDVWYSTGQTKEVYERIAQAYASQGTDIESYEVAMQPADTKSDVGNYPVAPVEPTQH